MEKPNVGDVKSTERGSGARFNAGKTPFRFIPLNLLAGAARVFEKVTNRPVNPYPLWNWAKGMSWSVPYECMLRHLDAWYRGEEKDPDSGESHIDHVICNALMLKHYETAYREGDDRPVKEFGDQGVQSMEERRDALIKGVMVQLPRNCRGTTAELDALDAGFRQGVNHAYTQLMAHIVDEKET